ncbi:MAG: glutamate-ammonia-ligase adenylyltransferase [Polaribacter sp.]|jgi:glutamate-ammonia-ligase adenylyltransferase
MSNIAAEIALAAIDSIRHSLETKLSEDIFQKIEYSINISRFVAESASSQPKEVVECFVWHKAHKAKDFSGHLCSEIESNLLIDSSITKIAYSESLAPSFNNIVEQFNSEESIMSYLRKIRYQHSAAIAILELNNLISIEESSARMSILAENLTNAAYFWCYAFQSIKLGLPYNSGSDNEHQNMLILAMGKFGGEELNFSSDIDLIFFYVNDGQTFGASREVSNSRFFQKVGIQIIKLLDEVTADGFVFRVDMRLRPYGDSGNLVMSLSQAEDYYHEQGRGWERFAMLRARVITGRSNEISLLNGIIKPFAFRRYIDYGVIDSLRNMKSMIQREVRRRGLKGNIKLGAGGIREIEFMVQSFQLIQGGRDKRLQEKNLLKVLPLLVEEKLLEIETANDLQDNYRFLRRLEHCIQELDEKQTQQLPNDDKTKKIIAELMSFNTWCEFNLALNEKLSCTNQHFSALFGEEHQSPEEQNDLYVSLWEGDVSMQEMMDETSLGEKESERLIAILDSFRMTNMVINLSSRGTKRLSLFIPKLLEICVAVIKPIETLERLLNVLRSILKRTAYLELLSENLPLLGHLVDLVSRSEWIAKRLSDCPILLDELLYPNSLYQPLQSNDLKSELQQSLLRIDEQDEEQFLNAIRQFKLINELRVAAAMLDERLCISQLSRYLTQIAEVIIQVGVNYSWRKITSKHGVPIEHREGALSSAHQSAIGFAVIAYGKLGGQELGFNSDLDLVFLYDKNNESMTDGLKPINVNRFYTRLSQKLIHFLSTRTSMGVLYEVDMRLRPSGNSGMLVSHIDAFEDYQTNNAWTWEHQALVRARVVVGDTLLCEKFEAVRHIVLTSKSEQKKLASDVVEMRNKMRENLDNTNKDKTTENNYDIKQGVGGLVDIEFLAQYLVLAKHNFQYNTDAKHKTDTQYKTGSSIPTNTTEMLKFVLPCAYISQKEAETLINSYRNYRNYLNERVIAGRQTENIRMLFEKEISTTQAIWDNVLIKQIDQDGN